MSDYKEIVMEAGMPKVLEIFSDYI